MAYLQGRASYLHPIRGGHLHCDTLEGDATPGHCTATGRPAPRSLQRPLSVDLDLESGRTGGQSGTSAAPDVPSLHLSCPEAAISRQLPRIDVTRLTALSLSPRLLWLDPTELTLCDRALLLAWTQMTPHILERYATWLTSPYRQLYLRPSGNGSGSLLFSHLPWALLNRDVP